MVLTAVQQGCNHTGTLDGSPLTFLMQLRPKDRIFKFFIPDSGIIRSIQFVDNDKCLTSGAIFSQKTSKRRPLTIYTVKLDDLKMLKSCTAGRILQVASASP